MNVGGAIALTGYLYQLLGSSALAMANGNKCTVLALEVHGEDALIYSENENVLIQFKYSLTGATLSPGDLAEILTKLESHSIGRSPKWKLVTNRTLSPTSNSIVQNLPRAQCPRGVKLENHATLKRLWSRLTLEYATLPDLRKFVDVHGKAFGLFDGEIFQGSNNVIMSCLARLSESPSGCAVTINEIDELFVGHNDPRKNTAQTLWQDAAAQIEEARDKAGPNFSDVIPRKALEDVLNCVESLVIVHGQGGSGKTLSVLELLYRHVSLNQQLGMALVSSEPATFGSVIAHWRKPNITSEPHEKIERSLERLMIANPNIHPLLFVALDGLDEQKWHRPAYFDEARYIIRRAIGRIGSCKDRPFPVKVVVTCRDRSEFDRLASEGGIGGTDVLMAPKFISLGEFQRDEFELLWAKWFKHLEAPLWREAAVRFEGYETALAGQESSNAFNDEVVIALKNPAMLGALRTLTTEDQQAILNGDEAAWKKLLETHIAWFIARVNRRLPVVRADEVNTVLQSVAHMTKNTTNRNHDFEKHWMIPATKGGVNSNVARGIFHDAETAGIVVADGRPDAGNRRLPVHWRWQHEFVCEYLASIF